MKKPLITSMLVTVEHDKPIPGLVDFVGQRAWAIDGVNVGSPRGAVTCRPVQAEPFDGADDAGIFAEALEADKLWLMDPDRGEEALELLRNLLEKHLEVHGGCTIERPVQEVHVSFPVVPQTRLSWWKRAINWLNT